jgi:hypothetical protein
LLQRYIGLSHVKCKSEFLNRHPLLYLSGQVVDKVGHDFLVSYLATSFWRYRSAFKFVKECLVVNCLLAYKAKVLEQFFYSKVRFYYIIFDLNTKQVAFAQLVFIENFCPMFVASFVIFLDKSDILKAKRFE